MKGESACSNLIQMRYGIRGNILAKEYGVFPGTISAIKRRATWKAE